MELAHLALNLSPEMQKELWCCSGNDEVERLNDGSIMLYPGMTGGVANRIFSNGALMAIEVMIFTNRICIAYPGTIYGCWDNMWCFDKMVNTFDVLRKWNWPAESEPTGWLRHPLSGRYREDGDPARELVKEF